MANPFYPPRASREAQRAYPGQDELSSAGTARYGTGYSSQPSQQQPFDPHRQPHNYGASTSAAAKRHSGGRRTSVDVARGGGGGGTSRGGTAPAQGYGQQPFYGDNAASSPYDNDGNAYPTSGQYVTPPYAMSSGLPSSGFTPTSGDPLMQSYQGTPTRTWGGSTVAGSNRGGKQDQQSEVRGQVPLSTVTFLAPPSGVPWNEQAGGPRPDSPAFFKDKPPRLDKLTPEQRKIAESFPKDLDKEGGNMMDDLKSFLRGWRRFVAWKYVPYYIITVIAIVLVALLTVYHKQIVDWLTPLSKKVKSVSWGWIIPVAILFVISFPPLFGHEIVGVLCGVVYGLWFGFGILSLGTVLGELGNFFAFKWCLQRTAEKYERKSLNYACMAHIVREGGFKVILLARLSAIPGHFTTAVFATVGMNVFIFTLACILSLPKQLVVVYVGVALEQSGSGTASNKDKIIQYVVLIVSTILTIWAAWYLYRRMDQARPIVQARLRERRFTMLSEAQILDGYDSRTPSDASPGGIPAKSLYGQGGEGIYSRDDLAMATVERLPSRSQKQLSREPSGSRSRGQRSSGGWSRWVNHGSRGDDDDDDDVERRGGGRGNGGQRQSMLAAAAPLGRIPSAESLVTPGYERDEYGYIGAGVGAGIGARGGAGAGSDIGAAMPRESEAGSRPNGAEQAAMERGAYQSHALVGSIYTLPHSASQDGGRAERGGGVANHVSGASTYLTASASGTPPPGMGGLGNPHAGIDEENEKQAYSYSASPSSSSSGRARGRTQEEGREEMEMYGIRAVPASSGNGRDARGLSPNQMPPPPSYEMAAGHAHGQQQRSQASEASWHGGMAL